MNVEFKNLLVRSFSLDWLEVTWEIANTTLDPHDFDWYIQRSESAMGPWDDLAGPFSDRYRFIDNRVNLLSRVRFYFYRIKSVRKADSTDIIYSDSFKLGGDPDLIAKEIQLLERLVFKEFIGRTCWIFPVRTFGQWCPSCMDRKGLGSTYRKLRSGCHTCYDTQYARGYLDPIEINVQFDPSPKSKQNLGTGQTEQVNTSARLGNFPPLKQGDIIVEAENRRWRIVQVSTTERLRSPVHQELQLHELVPSDIEFKLPINIDDLRALEPSPERNFSNPQNLESFEDESIQAVLKSYGYDND